MTDDIIDEAEAVVRAAASDIGLQLDALEPPLALAAVQLQQAVDEAQEALRRLLSAGEAYSALQAGARAQVAALGLPCVDAAGTLTLRGRTYPTRSAASFAAATLCYTLNAHIDLPAGSRIRVAVDRVEGEGI